MIRRAVPSDAAALAEIARRTFVDTFAAANRPEDIEEFVARTYGEAQQRREIENPDGVTLLVDEQGSFLAFAQLRRAPTEHGEVEIARFYVDRAHHGAGLARSLMDAAIEVGRELGAERIWLGVWEHNPRAIRFYEKGGFRDVGSHPFLVGGDLQTDRLMTFVMPAR
ncbi:MAG: GNAT family N-acetyltransferase [Acidobacteriota bacterium]